MKKPKNNSLITVGWFFLYVFVIWFAVLLSANYKSGISILELIPELTKSFDDPFTLSYRDC